MSCACCNTTTKKTRMSCPACGQNCFPVSRQTMLHQVQFPENQAIDETDYAFCSNLDCHVGYFSASGSISKTSLRAFQPRTQAMLCHCFDISKSIYRTALDDGTAETMKNFIVQQTKAGLCACEPRNPSGRCCLASFKQMEKAHDG